MNDFFYEDVRDILVTQGVGTYGTDIFVGPKAVLPPLSDVSPGTGPILSVIQTGGSGSDKTQNDSSTELPTAQIVVRATSYDDAMTMLIAAYAALGGADGLFNFDISGARYIRLVARQPPTDLTPDGAARAMVGFNIEAEKQSAVLVPSMWAQLDWIQP